MKIFHGKDSNDRNLLAYIFFYFWFLIWTLSTAKDILLQRGYYQFALRASPEYLRAERSVWDVNSIDFYRILKICDQTLAPSDKLQLILPQDNQRNFEFLRDMGRYILYPRNYGENTTLQNYILVYQVDNFRIPEGYEVKTSFSENKYLLKKREPSANGN